MLKDLRTGEGREQLVPVSLFCSGLSPGPGGEGHSGNPGSRLGQSTKSSVPGPARMGWLDPLALDPPTLFRCVWRVWRNLSSLSHVAMGPLRPGRSEDGGRETQQGRAELGREPRCVGPCSRGVACHESWDFSSFKGLGTIECPPDSSGLGLSRAISGGALSGASLSCLSLLSLSLHPTLAPLG